jgi:hypothetical protein
MAFEYFGWKVDDGGVWELKLHPCKVPLPSRTARSQRKRPPATRFFDVAGQLKKASAKKINAAT